MLEKIRVTPEKINRKREIVYCISWIIVGLVLGVFAKYAGVIVQGSSFRNFIFQVGNMLSSFSLWILLGVVISIYSQKSITAAVNVALFFFAMLLSYYLYSAWIVDYLAPQVVIGWSIVAVLSSIAGYFTWYAKNDSHIKSGIVRILGLAISIAPIAFLITTMIPTYRIYRQEGLIGIPFAVALIFMLQKGAKERFIVAGISIVVGVFLGIIGVIEFVFGSIL